MQHIQNLTQNPKIPLLWALMPENFMLAIDQLNGYIIAIESENI